MNSVSNSGLIPHFQKFWSSGSWVNAEKQKLAHGIFELLHRCYYEPHGSRWHFDSSLIHTDFYRHILALPRMGAEVKTNYRVLGALCSRHMLGSLHMPGPLTLQIQGCYSPPGT